MTVGSELSWNEIDYKLLAGVSMLYCWLFLWYFGISGVRKPGHALGDNSVTGQPSWGPHFSLKVYYWYCMRIYHPCPLFPLAPTGIMTLWLSPLPPPLSKGLNGFVWLNWRDLYYTSSASSICIYRVMFAYWSCNGASNCFCWPFASVQTLNYVYSLPTVLCMNSTVHFQKQLRRLFCILNHMHIQQRHTVGYWTIG